MNLKSEKGYVGAAPGQALDSVLARVTLRDLQGILGEAVLPLLDPERLQDRTSLVTATCQVLRSDPSLLANPTIKKLILRNLDLGKMEELRDRFGPDRLIDAELDTSAGLSIFCGFLGVASVESQTALPVPSKTVVEAQFGLFPHQRSIVRRTHKKIGAGVGRLVVHMPTGSGKTRTAMHFAARILNEFEPCTIVWLASGQELLEQAADAFETAWRTLGNRPLDLRRFWGSHLADPNSLEDGILVGGFAKMHAWQNRHPIDALHLGNRTRLVIVDEAHQAIATTYRNVIESLADAGQNNAILGLTATPGRTWSDIDQDEALAAFFNNEKVVLEIDGYDNPVEYLLNEGYLSRPSFTRIDYDAPIDDLKRKRNDDSEYDEEMLDALARTDARNLAIINSVRGLIARGHLRIILFATSVLHAKIISTALILHDVESTVVTGETPAGRRSEILRRFRSGSLMPIVLCNFGVLTTGFDAPSTSAAIIARPTKSLVLFSQMVGRATRGPKAGGNAESEILTVHDPSCPGFGDIAEAFYNWEDIWHD